MQFELRNMIERKCFLFYRSWRKSFAAYREMLKMLQGMKDISEKNKRTESKKKPNFLMKKRFRNELKFADINLPFFFLNNTLSYSLSYLSQLHSILTSFHSSKKKTRKKLRNMRNFLWGKHSSLMIKSAKEHRIWYVLLESGMLFAIGTLALEYWNLKCLIKRFENNSSIKKRKWIRK